jgi:hypothetical protein
MTVARASSALPKSPKAAVRPAVAETATLTGNACLPINIDLPYAPACFIDSLTSPSDTETTAKRRENSGFQRFGQQKDQKKERSPQDRVVSRLVDRSAFGGSGTIGRSRALC